MKVVWAVTDTIAAVFRELAERIEQLMSNQARIFLLWLVVGVLLIANIADNQTAVEAVWRMTTAQADDAELFGLWKLTGAFVLSMLFIICEGNLIMGFRDPEDAQPRFDKANAFRTDKPSDNAPNSAEFFYSALMNGELFDIRLAQGIGVGVFLLDCFIQYHNRTWDTANNGQMLVSLGHALLMLVGTELAMVMIRVMKSRNYREPSTSRQGPSHDRQQSNQGRKSRKRQAEQQQDDVFMIPDGSGGYVQVNSAGQPV